MIDFTKYTLPELQAVADALDTLTNDIVERDLSVGWVFREYRNSRAAVEKKIAQQARDHAAAEAEKVDRIKQALDAAGDPPASNPPAEDPDDLQALVDTLSRCSDQLAALAAAEDKHFAECSQTVVFNKLTMLRECKQALNNMVSDIRDHYDGLH